MHPEAYGFVESVSRNLVKPGLRVLEIGSLDVNGSARALFSEADRYYGIDRENGRGVDQVIDAREYDGMGKFDVVITTETLEHDSEPEKIIECAARALKPGGLLIITAAGPDRTPHNTDGTPWDGAQHYKNIEPDLLKKWLADWDHVNIVENPVARDIYATAYKAEPKPVEEEPAEEEAPAKKRPAKSVKASK